LLVGHQDFRTDSRRARVCRNEIVDPRETPAGVTSAAGSRYRPRHQNV